MKVLSASIRFLLPPDFEGGLSDALRAAADYLDDPERGLDELPSTAAVREPAPEPFYLNSRMGLRLMGRSGMHYLKDEGREPWKAMDQKLGPRTHRDGQAWVK